MRFFLVCFNDVRSHKGALTKHRGRTHCRKLRLRQKSRQHEKEEPSLGKRGAAKANGTAAQERAPPSSF